MHEELYELKEKLLKEFGEYSKNGKFSKEDSEVMKNLSGTIDHICNIIEREEEKEYSQRAYDNGNMGGGSYRGGYSRNRDNSYRMNGNSYARGRGQNARRDSMGRYSRGGDMVDQLEDLMEDAPNDQIRQQIQQLITQVEKM
jgi:hypothetical protein